MTIFKLLVVPLVAFAAFFLVADSVLAQMTTPGVPNTSLGGSSLPNLILMTISGIFAVWGALYIRRHLIG